MRNKLFKLFLSEEEHAMLFEKSNAAGIPASAFLRLCIEGKDVQVFPLSEDVIASVKAYLNSLSSDPDMDLETL